MEKQLNLLSQPLTSFKKAVIWHSEGISFFNIGLESLDSLIHQLDGAIIERIRVFSPEEQKPNSQPDELHIWRVDGKDVDASITINEIGYNYRYWSGKYPKESFKLKTEEQLLSGTTYESASESKVKVTELRGINYSVPEDWLGTPPNLEIANSQQKRLVLSMEAAYRFDPNCGYTLVDYRYINIKLI